VVATNLGRESVAKRRWAEKNPCPVRVFSARSSTVYDTSAQSSSRKSTLAIFLSLSFTCRKQGQDPGKMCVFTVPLPAKLPGQETTSRPPSLTALCLSLPTADRTTHPALLPPRRLNIHVRSSVAGVERRAQGGAKPKSKIGSGNAECEELSTTRGEGGHLA